MAQHSCLHTPPAALHDFNVVSLLHNASVVQTLANDLVTTLASVKFILTVAQRFATVQSISLLPLSQFSRLTLLVQTLQRSPNAEKSTVKNIIK